MCIINIISYKPLDEKNHMKFSLWFKEKMDKFKLKIDLDAKTHLPVKDVDDLSNIEAKLTKKALVLVSETIIFLKISIMSIVFFYLLHFD